VLAGQLLSRSWREQRHRRRGRQDPELGPAHCPVNGSRRAPARGVCRWRQWRGQPTTGNYGVMGVALIREIVASHRAGRSVAHEPGRWEGLGVTNPAEPRPAGLPLPGVEIAPLNATTFVQRLRQLTDAVRSLDRLRAAMVSQHPRFADGLLEDPSSPERD
jgi:hypothetical protein